MLHVSERSLPHIGACNRQHHPVPAAAWQQHSTLSQSYLQRLPKPRQQRCRSHRHLLCHAVAAESLSADLQKLDSLLEREGDAGEKEAVQYAEELKSKGYLSAYGQGRQVPKRIYSLEELRLNKIDATQFLSPDDDRIARIRTACQAGILALLIAASYILHLDVEQAIILTLIVAVLYVSDQIANGGGYEGIALDSIARAVDSNYGSRVAAHEAAHFFVAYLLGILPRRYTLSSIDAWKKYGAFNVQAGTQFCDSAFQAEIAKGTLSSTSLDKYCCVALAGVAVEYVKYGKAEGGLNDINQLDSLLKALKFTQAKADGQIRWAVLNVTSLLRRHKDAHGQLAAAMAANKPVSECIGVLENALEGHTDI